MFGYRGSSTPWALERPAQSSLESVFLIIAYIPMSFKYSTIFFRKEDFEVFKDNNPFKYVNQLYPQ